MFDLIGGTSTGGIIALCIGTGALNAENTMKLYTEQAPKIFIKKHIPKAFMLFTNHYYEIKPLEEYLNEVFGTATMNMPMPNSTKACLLLVALPLTSPGFRCFNSSAFLYSDFIL